MSIRSSLAFFAAILSATAVSAATTTTTVLLCATTNDAAIAAANQEASGWTFLSPGSETQAKEGSYYYPIKFVGGTVATSAAAASGSYMTNLVLGVKIGNVARTVTVTPYDSTGTAGTAQTQAPASTGSLLDMNFVFLPAEDVSYVKISIASSGNATAYLYYATITTETPSGGSNTAPTASEPSVDVAATVGTVAELDLADYFSDADGDPLTYALVSGDGDMAGSIWYFTPAYEGEFSAEVSATDPSGASATMYLSITATAPGPMPLDAPSIEPVYPEAATTNGFVLRWLSVDNAGGYEITVTNVADQMEAGFQVSYSGPFPPDDLFVAATVTGLDSDTAYEAAVRAVASSPDYSDSDWSSPVSITTALEDGLQRAVLLDEGFSGADNAWRNTSAKPGDNETDCDSWSFSANTANTRSSIKVGGADAVGWALSPEITLSNEVASATVSVSFLAAAYPTKTTKFTVSVVDLSTAETNAIPALTEIAPAALDNTSEPDLSGVTEYTVAVTVPTHFKLLFETLSSGTDKRLLLDSIKVTQIYDPNYAVLAAPTGVVESAVGTTGFTVSWDPIGHAEGYEVWLNGAFEDSCAATDTSMQLTGLEDSTTYSVQVKALGDNLHYGDSPLSDELSVTTPVDAQKIDFTVTGAPAGDVFAGDTVTFTVTAESESTHESAPVSFSGIAGATFNAGAFSWITTESDVGSHTATFTSGSYSTNVAITVVSAFVTTNLFHEAFTNCTTKWSASADMPVNGASSKETFVDEPGWTFIDCLRGMSGLKMGTEKVFGSATTRMIEPLSTSIPVQLSFRAAAYAGKTNCTIAVSVSDTTGIVFSQVVNLTPMPDLTNAIPDGASYEFGPFDVSVSGEFTLSFTPSTGDGRMGVDDILATQTVSAKMQTLTAPTGLAVVGEAGETGFTVGWSAVAGATNYAVRVADAAGAVVFSAPFCPAALIAVTGLADDVSYTVQVRATGDEALWFASTWSDALVVRTARSALHPTLSFGPWTNVANEADPVATLANTAPVSAALDGGANAVVEYVSATPAPDSAPTFAAGTLSWTPAETDAEKTFALTFTMAADEEGAPVYTTNVVVSVGRLPETAAPAVTVANVAWNSFELRWDDQYRASDYRVRVWTGTSDPDATGTEYSVDFEGFPTVKPDGWSFDNGDESYPSAGWEKTRLAFKNDGSVTSPELSGSVTNLSFEIRVDSGSVSVLTVEGWNRTAWVAITNFTGGTLKTEKKVIAGLAGAYSRFRWTYTKNGGKNCGLGSIVFSGTGLPTARFLAGWETPGKSIGKVTSVTVAKPFPGRFTGRVRNPQTGKWEDAGTTCVNYAEVMVVGTDGKTASAVVAVPVPFPPRSARATLMILQ